MAISSELRGQLDAALWCAAYTVDLASQLEVPAPMKWRLWIIARLLDWAVAELARL